MMLYDPELEFDCQLSSEVYLTHVNVSWNVVFGVRRLSHHSAKPSRQSTTVAKEYCPNFVGAYLRGRPFAARSGRPQRDATTIPSGHYWRRSSVITASQSKMFSNV